MLIFLFILPLSTSFQLFALNQHLIHFNTLIQPSLNVDKQWAIVPFTFQDSISQTFLTYSFTSSSQIFVTEDPHYPNIFQKSFTSNLITYPQPRNIYLIFPNQHSGNTTVYLSVQLPKSNLTITIFKEFGYLHPDQLHLNISSKLSTTTYNFTNISFDIDSNFDIVLYTEFNSSLFIGRPILEHEDNNQNQQEIQIRSSDPDGAFLELENNQIVFNVKISCFAISDQQHTILLGTPSIEDSIEIKFNRKCQENDIQKQVSHLSEFPLIIETELNSADVFNRGRVMDHYNINNNNIRIIRVEEQAEIFYVRLAKSQIKPQIIYEQFFVNYTKSVIKLKNENPLKNRVIQEGDNLKFLFIFQCKKVGKTLVTAQWDFLIEHSLQTIRIDFYKECRLEDDNVVGQSRIEIILYYFICILGIIFGICTINCFKNLMKNKELFIQEENMSQNQKKKGNKSLIISYI